MRVKIVTYVPKNYAITVREALGQAGAGQIGEYSHCSFSVDGIGRFTPSDKANPLIGEEGRPEEVQEERIEVVCDRGSAKQVIAVLREAHPYVLRVGSLGI